MRKILIGILIFNCLTTVLYAEVNEQLTAKQNIVNRQSFLNNLTDSLSTMGKSGTQKAAIINKRKEARRIARLQNLTKNGSLEMRAKKKERKKINAQLKKKAPRKNY